MGETLQQMANDQLKQLSQALAGIGSSGGAGTSLSLSGSASVNLGTQIWVPNGAGGYKQVTIQQFVEQTAASNPAYFQSLYSQVEKANIGTPTKDRQTQMAQVADAIYLASQGAPAGKFNIDDLPKILSNVAGQGNGTTTGVTGESARFYKGSATEIALTTPQSAALTIDQTYQKLLGRHATQDEINGIVGQINQQEYGEGAARVSVNQEQQAGLVAAYTGGAVNGGFNAAQWASQVLQDAGLPVTQQNLANMLIWMQNENHPNDWAPRNNPLNASLGTSASDGTAGYSDLATAAHYTAQMLLQQNMGGIYGALKSGTTDQATFGQAVIDSPWASSHYDHNLSRFTGTPDLAGEAAGVASGAGPGTTTPGASSAAAGSGAPAGSGTSSVTPQQLQQLPVGQPMQAGAPQSFQAGSQTDIVMPPTVAVTQTPSSAEAQAAYSAMHDHPTEYQTENLVNVMGAINQMFKAPSNPALQGAESMP